MTYISQTTVLGFNSQKYDVPLIRKYLPASLIKAGCVPQFVVKKMGGYMAIATKKLKFLDITNYLAAGTSLAKFYASYGVTTAKGFFPYSWFDSLDKLTETSLPDNDKFYSILTKKTITLEEHQLCQDVWTREGMVVFADFVRYYNNGDVVGFVEAVEKIVANERENKLDIFKESISLPGLTQRYLFMNLPRDDYFVGFAREHKHLLKLLKDNIVGGPSIIFHRYHEKDVTLIKGKHLCKKVIGYDANSLYLYCLAQNMPTGFYEVLEKKNNYVREGRYSREAIQWLEHVMRTTEGVHIRHAENGGEVRIENFYVDGYDESTRTVYEYHGCFWHKHFCHAGYDAEVWNNTLQRERTIRDLGYNVISITSCVWKKMPESKDWYRPTPTVPTTTVPAKTQDEILDDVRNEVIEGFAVYSVHVPDEKKARFSEFPPIFKNCEITIADIGEHMQEFCRHTTRKTGVKRSLISSMYGENILTHTALLKQYLDMGLIVTNVETVIVYNGKKVFDWFMKEVCQDRRRADLGGEEYQVKGDASKLKGNCGYGRTLMDKSKHTRVSFVKERNLPNQVNNPLFKHYDELNEEMFEVEKMKKKVMLDLPTQIGIAVFSYAKLRLIQFWDFINTFLVNDLYQLMECDTDSLYIAFARDTIDECVKPEMRERWESEKWTWFSSEDKNSNIIFEGQTITVAQWDKRTPGKFKPEFEGDGMICLNSKVFHIWGCDKDGKLITKTSAKGSQKKRNELLKSHFLEVLQTKEHHEVENAGFIKDNQGVIKTYTQKKRGFGYFYAKRKVLADGVFTSDLDI